MPRARLPMRKIREVLHLFHGCGLSTREIARALQIGKSTVQDYLSRARGADLSWPLPAEMDNHLLEDKLFGSSLEKGSKPKRQAHINFHYFDQELQKKGVTFTLLWEEYKRQHPDGYQYSRLRELYCQWKGSVDLPMRQEHKAGEKLFIDYCGQTMPYRDENGIVQQAAIFVAVLGASNYTFACATASQSLPDWLDAHVQAFSFFDGVPKVLVPDNLKSAVTRACIYEPDINESYLELARHYRTAVVPARVRKPKDKAKAEIGVQLVQRWICAALRDQTFISLDQLNAAIKTHLETLNNKPFKKLPGNRLDRFNATEKAVLKPLPENSYEYAAWRRSRVGRDYHIALGDHHYSVPHRYAGQMVDIRANARTIEVFSKHERIACHPRVQEEGQSTIRGHMPPNHRRYAGWNPRELCAWATGVGPWAQQVFQAVFADEERTSHQQIRCCVGLMNLARGFGVDRFEAACKRAAAYDALSFRSIQSILKNRLDQQTPDESEEQPNVKHVNIRGPQYYT